MQSAALCRRRSACSASSSSRRACCSSAALAGISAGSRVGAAIAAIIAGYTVVDRYGIQHAAAGPYLLLIMVGPAILYPLAIGRRRLRAAAGWAPLAVGAGLSVAYLLVLLALRVASAPAVSAVRETSVVIATVLAAVFLHERVSRGRLAGSVLVAAGVALLALS